jgi:uncharacterized protein
MTQASPPSPELLQISGPAGQIEAVMEMAESPTQPVLAIICHPLPTEGGSMHNKVVTMSARALRECGIHTLRFNFRGVGSSEGQFDAGVGELEDLHAVAAWARTQHPDKTLWLAGFSFGSWVSIRAADALQAGALISIAPPVGRRSWDFSNITLPQCPWLVIQGDADEVVDAQAVYDWVAQLPHPPQLLRLADTSHFFHGKLLDLRNGIKQAVHAWLNNANLT